MYFYRHLQTLLSKLIVQFPAILVTGPRQVGKSTLLQHIGEEYRYITFDNPASLDLAQNEPTLFFLNYDGKLILDEVQYAPELFSSLKWEIDKRQENGVFLLSGSQAFQLMQNISETLAGRIAILKLQGFSLREIHQVDFNRTFIPNQTYLHDREKQLHAYPSVWQTIHKGYMPRLYQQEIEWEIYYSSYVATYIERDVQQLTNVGNRGDFMRFMVAIAARSGELLNYSNVAQDVGVSVDTVKRWLTILQTSGIVYLLQPYSHNHLKRAIKTPKVFMLDTGLMAWLTKWLTVEALQNGAKSGQFFETFVVSEIIKSFYNQGTIEPLLYYYRDTNQKEIDLIIADGQTLYPVEIKSTASPNKRMAKNIELFRNYFANSEITVAHGTIINQYPEKLWLSTDLVAVPINYI
ncbi:ATP-binding protein [Pasteurella testudinis]|uniref:ATP-binding protein n=1 Tax=Pasteurella testudinis TaxID=761 RepID=UPI004059E37F